jgi:hypothetical protein
MLTLDEYNSLTLHDSVETDFSIMPALAPNGIVLRVVSIDPGHACVDFVVTWLGITLGRWKATSTEVGVTWSFK